MRLSTAAFTITALLGFSGCERPHQRFVPFGDNISFALDTKTGQTCATVPKNGSMGQSFQRAGWPFCYDLYKESK